MTIPPSRMNGDLAAEPAGPLGWVLRALDPFKSYTTYPEGSILLLRDRPVAGVFLLVEGSAKVSISSGRGATIILGIARPGEILGLSAAIAGTPSEITAETIAPSRLCFIHRDDLLRTLNLSGESCLQVVELISRQLREAFELIRIIGGARPARRKLAALLLNWASSHGTFTEQGIEIELRLTEEEIGQMIGSSRGTVSRLLAALKREQIVSVNGSALCIRNKAALQKLAACKRRRTKVRQTGQAETSA
jgi:CRP/FNR family transcriptional regulator, cyclic AMP receptor protein